jgi:hypothetical protein
MSHVGFPGLWQAFHLAKRGHSSDEYEDAYAADPEAGRFAIADGAAESSFAGLWARLLTTEFVQALSDVDPEGRWLEPLRQRWAAEVDHRPLPWYADVKREEGAFATFLGLVIQPPDVEFGRTDCQSVRGEGRIANPSYEPGGDWQAQAVGDTCLLQVRAGSLIEAFPLTRGDEFGNHPCLLGSRPTTGRGPPPSVRQSRGRWQRGDRFFLVTDALAQWFLRQTEAGRHPWEAIGRIRAGPAPATFHDWIEELRDRDGLRNDDVTLVLIDL